MKRKDFHLMGFSLFLVFFVNNVLSQVPARYDTTCGLLLNKIYCFGSVAAGSKNGDSSISMLDIFSYSGSTLNQLQNQWVTITANTNGIYYQSRENPQGMALPDGKSMLLSGGYNTAESYLVAQTVVYDAVNNTWTNYSSYSEPPYGIRQIYYGSSVYIPSKGVGFFGGLETNKNDSWTYNGRNMSIFNDANDATGRDLGYTRFTLLDITKSSPWSIPTPQTNLPTNFYLFQASIFDAKTNLVYFLGGEYLDTNATVHVNPFSSALTFNVLTGNWSTQILSGPIPTPRIHFTATLLTSTQRDILLYGGDSYDNNYIASADYCYTLNLDNFQWKQQNIAAPQNTILSRTRHSAVLVNNSTLFIVFGKDNTDVPTSSLLALNTTDPSNISLLAAYVDPNAPPPSSGPKLGSGVIAGIAVGAAAAVILGIIGICLCLRRKRRKAKKQRAKEEALEAEIKQQQQKDGLNEEVMEVNWDEIEKKYIEISGSRLGYTPKLADDITATLVDDNSEYTRSGSPMMHNKHHPSMVSHQRPDAIEEEDATTPHHYIQLQKPDGA